MREARALERLAGLGSDQIVLAEDEPASQRRLLRADALAESFLGTGADPIEQARHAATAISGDSQPLGPELEAGTEPLELALAKRVRGCGESAADLQPAADRQLAHGLASDYQHAALGSLEGHADLAEAAPRHGGDEPAGLHLHAGGPAERSGVDRSQAGGPSAEAGEGPEGQQASEPRKRGEAGGALAPEQPATDRTRRGRSGHQARQPSRRGREVRGEQQSGGEPGDRDVAPPAERPAHGCRRSPSASIVAGPIPGISSSCSIEETPPCSSRYSRMSAAVTGPIPSIVSRSA